MKTIFRMEKINHVYFTLFQHQLIKYGSILLIGLMISMVGSALYAQDARISIQVHNLPVRDVLKMIESKSTYHFAYNNKLIDVNRTVTINASNAKISDILKQIFAGTDVTTSLVDHQIVLASVQSMGESVKQASHQKITGNVIDEKGQAIPGVTVMIEGTKKGTITDDNGNFTLLNVSPSDVLEFSFVGMQKSIIKVGDHTVINVIMKEATTGLNEVVVMGYGTQKIKDVTGAISVVSAKDLENRPMLQITNALEGQMSGVQVVDPSGKPENSGFVRIRGTTSINASSEPLYIIDGIPTTNIYAINPNDIDNVTVLKDASSAAIYGAAGANGVILITTKKGENNSPRIDVSSYVGTSTVSKYLNVLNAGQYVDLMTEMGYNANWSQYNQNTDWQKQIFHTAFMQNYQVSLSRSLHGTDYYLSANYSNQEGIVKTNLASRYNLRAKIDQKVNKWLTIGTVMTYSKWHDVNVPDNLGAGQGGVIMSALTTPPNIGIYNANGTFAGNPLMPSFENPVAYVMGPIQNFYDYRFLGNIYLEAQLFKGLKFKTMYGVDNDNSDFNYFLNPFSTDWGRTNHGIAQASSNKSEYWISENTLNYEQKIRKNSLDVLGGFVASKTTVHSMALQTTNFSSSDITTANGGSVISYATGNASVNANLSFLGRINYGYDERYLLTCNFRADASSVFGPGKQWGYFPSFSAGWRISEESFMKKNGIFDNLKLRVGWGSVGNDNIANYAWYGQIQSGANYAMGGQIQPGTAPLTLENRDLKWETTNETNLGLDLAILNSRLSLTVNAYNKQTKDLLLNVPIPTSTGYSSALKNIGSIQNRGLEFQFTSINLRNPLRWTTNLNLSFNRNKAINLDHQIIYDGGIYQRDNVSIASEGHPLGIFWGYISDGVDPQTGMIKYRDLNQDGMITADDETIIGDPNPKFIYGMNNKFEFKNFELSLFIQGIYGNNVFNATRLETEAMDNYLNQLSTVLNRWQTIGQITNVPKATPGDDTNSLLSTRFIESGSYLRIKTASISYSFPKNILNKIKVQALRLYVSSENLFTFTHYSGYSPEVNAYGNSNIAQGIDYGTYPQSRNVIFGFNASF